MNLAPSGLGGFGSVPAAQRASVRSGVRIARGLAPWLGECTLLGVCTLLGACSTQDPPAPVAPVHEAGTVLLVDGLVLRAEDLSTLCADISALYPEYSDLHTRRLALTNELLPRLAARAIDPERWDRARQACEAAEVELSTLEPLRQEGNFRALGLALWSAARHLTIGEWSGPLELTGRWLRLRLDSRTERPDPREEELRVALLEFPYLDREGSQVAIEAAIDRARLTLVDPEFAEAVPEKWKHRMHAVKP